MQYLSSKKLDNQFVKLPKKIQEQFHEKLTLFKMDPFNPLLNNHCVHHPYEGCQSINITGDMRALFEISNNRALFIRVGSHSELYK